MARLTAKKLKEFTKEAREELLSQIEGSLENKLPKHFEIYSKIVDVEQLPKRSECIRLMRKVDKKFGGGVYGELLHRRNYFQIVHDKLIEDLVRLMHQLNPGKVVEICAGMGKLSYWLSENGIDITATDSGDRIKSTYVERMGYAEALSKLNPKIIITAWPEPEGVKLVRDVLKHPSVENLIILGKGGYLSRKYWKTIAKRAEVIPLELRTSPSRIDSMMNDKRYGREIERTIKKFFQVGKSTELYQSVLIRTKRK